MASENARRVLISYPQIYLACHTRHVRGRRSGHALSARESSILAHLSEHEAISPVELAKHLGVTAGTLSEAIDELVAQEYVVRERRTDDRRRVDLWLSEKGAQAMEESSVLDAQRVERVLIRLTAAEREQAVRGMELLARASREQAHADSANRSWVKRRGKASARGRRY